MNFITSSREFQQVNPLNLHKVLKIGYNMIIYATKYIPLKLPIQLSMWSKNEEKSRVIE